MIRSKLVYWMNSILLCLLFAVCNQLASGQTSASVLTAITGNPPNVSFSFGGQTGSSVTFNYAVVANFVGGSVPSNAIVVRGGPSVLSSVNFIALTWTPVGGATSYDVLRLPSTTLPYTASTVAVAVGITTTSFNDIGGSLSSYTLAGAPPAPLPFIYFNSRDFNPPALYVVGIGQINSASAPTGPAGGVLSGTFPNPGFHNPNAAGGPVVLDGSGNATFPGTIAVDGCFGCGAATTAFNAITSGTNVSAAMLVGNGGSLGFTGSGTIGASTAAALLGIPTLCTTGFAPTGILANGNATGCAAIGGGGSPGFNSITSGTNVSAAMLVGIGASLGVTGSGTIAATSSLTAAALASTPTLCSTGNAPTGILPNGNATGCAAIGGGGSTAFSALTGGTNTTANMVIGSGASLSATGSGIIVASAGNATALNGNIIPNNLSVVGTNGSGQLVAGLPAFNTLSNGTNTTANMLVGTGASLAPTGSGTVSASTLASTPTLCSSGNAPTGILANGNATGCAPLSGGATKISGTATFAYSTSICDGCCVQGPSTITVTGVALGDAISIGMNPEPPQGVNVFGKATATNTVTVETCNNSGSPSTPASTVYLALTVH